MLLFDSDDKEVGPCILAEIDSEEQAKGTAFFDVIHTLKIILYRMSESKVDII